MVRIGDGVAIKGRVRCPECGSTKLTKDGWKIRSRRKRQRYLCGNCGRLTIIPKVEGE